MAELNIKNLRPKKPYGKSITHIKPSVQADILHRRQQGQTISRIADFYGVTGPTIARVIKTAEQ